MKAGELVAVPALVVSVDEEGVLVQTRAPGGRVVRMRVAEDLLTPIEHAGDAAYDDVLEFGEAAPEVEERSARTPSVDELDSRMRRVEAGQYAHRMALEEMGASELLERKFLEQHGPARG